MRLFVEEPDILKPTEIKKGDNINLKLDGKVYVYQVDGVYQDGLGAPITLKLKDPE